MELFERDYGSGIRPNFATMADIFLDRYKGGKGRHCFPLSPIDA
jgi:hypothetical protein